MCLVESVGEQVYLCNMGYFQKLKKTDEEWPDQVPEIKDVKAVCVEMKSLCASMVTITPWINGEGYDISIDREKGEHSHISMHEDEIEAILRGLKHLKRI